MMTQRSSVMISVQTTTWHIANINQVSFSSPSSSSSFSSSCYYYEVQSITLLFSSPIVPTCCLTHKASGSFHLQKADSCYPSVHPSITIQVTLPIQKALCCLLHQSDLALGHLFECRDVAASIYTVWDSHRGWSKFRVTHVHKKSLKQLQYFLSVLGPYSWFIYSKQLSHSQFIAAKDKLAEGRIPFGSLGFKIRGNDPFMFLTD